MVSDWHVASSLMTAMDETRWICLTSIVEIINIMLTAVPRRGRPVNSGDGTKTSCYHRCRVEDVLLAAIDASGVVSMQINSHIVARVFCTRVPVSR